ncbi:c-type cytochrome, partial [Deinococcus sp.]|uniref:c-type cytochrome n=1 Tax=Deinococcus sp. TaxID=47478 RepID=UPI00286D9B7C
MRLKWSRRWIAFMLVALIAGLVAIVTAVPTLSWRAKVVGLKLAGKIPEIPTTDLARWLVPGSSTYLGGMEMFSNVEAGVLNIWQDDPAYAKRGEEQFLRVCAACHGGNAQGGSAPNLLAFLSRSTDWSFFSTVKWGRKGTAMAAQPVAEREIWEVQAYLRTKTRAWAREAAAHLAAAPPKVDVLFSKLLNAADYPDEWLMYSGDMHAQRHSRLNQINRSNVRDLRVAWATQLRPAT